MTLDGFLSVLSIAIAVFALMTPVQKMKARLSLGMQMLLAIAFLGTVIYLEFFTTLKQPCILSTGWCQMIILDPPRTLEPGQVAFVIILLWMGLAYFIHQYTRPWAAALKTIWEIVGLLLAERKYEDLMVFVKPHLPFLNAGAERRFLLQTMHDWFANLAPNRSPFAHPDPPGKRNVPDHAAVKALKARLSVIRHVIPAEKKFEDLASSILVRLLRSDDLRRAISKDRPYLGLELLSIKRRETHDFLDGYFRELLTDRDSIFYQEMKAGLGSSMKEGFSLESANRFQNYFLEDCRVADDLSVWQPIGNYIEELLRGEHGQAYVDKLNGAKTNPAMDRDPVLMAIQFFDIMVRRAAYQNVNSHMWLMYLTHFVEYIVGSTGHRGGDEDDGDEFPTFGMYLIYEVFNTLGDWVQLTRYLPSNSIHLRYDDRGVASIPKFAAEAIGRSLKIVLTSNRVSEDLKAYIYTVAMRDVKGLVRQGHTEAARAMFIRRIVAGGEPRGDLGFRGILKSYLSSIDAMLKYDVEDFVEALDNVV